MSVSVSVIVSVSVCVSDRGKVGLSPERAPASRRNLRTSIKSKEEEDWSVRTLHDASIKGVRCVQGYLAQKTPPPRRTLQ